MVNRTQKFLLKLQEKKGDDFQLIGEYEGSQKPAKFKHNVCGHIWVTQPRSILHSKGSGCPKCSRLTPSETFDKQLHEVSKGTIRLHPDNTYQGSRVKTKFTHITCGNSFIDEPYLLLKSGTCHHCRGELSGGAKKTTEDFKNDLKRLKGSDYLLADNSEYTGALNKVRVIHTSCGEEFEVRASHILHTSGCPKCKLSKGEEFIDGLLKSLGCVYERQYTFQECKNTKPLPFDFAILNNKDQVTVLIEYDGIQHFKPFPHFGGEEKFKKQIKNDNIKNKYCKENNIPLIRVSYQMSDKDIRDLITKVIREK